IHILDDGSLTAQDYRLLEFHLRPLQIEYIANIQQASFPVGGCWERLIKAIELSYQRYVIQLDSDTLTLKHVPEVVKAIRNNYSFTLGSADGLEFTSITAASCRAASSPSQHIQARSERLLVDAFPNVACRYVRGCAAFAGFAKGAHPRDSLEAFSSHMA